jgi:hypothetical protein
MKAALVRRLGIAFLIGMLAGVLINELTFLFVREDSRAPQRIELVIPAGTADLVARGQQPPSLPDRMSFVVGDTLVVTNRDSVDHKLGPIWIPAGSQASLNLDVSGQYADECSFQTTRYLNLDVHAPLTIWTRFEGSMITGIPLGILLALYALIAWPMKKT